MQSLLADMRQLEGRALHGLACCRAKGTLGMPRAGVLVGMCRHKCHVKKKPRKNTYNADHFNWGASLHRRQAADSTRLCSEAMRQ